MNRRRVLVAGGLLATPAGCLSVAPGEDEEPPAPVVEDVRVPAVEHADGGAVPPVEPIDGDGNEEFAATFENVGDAGEAAISLYLLESHEADESVLSAAAAARVITVPFAAGERREISFDDVSPAGHDAYYLEAGVGSVEADVRNAGGSGLVAVALTPTNGEATDERRTLEFEAGATETVSFGGPFAREAYDVRATVEG